MDTLHTSAGGQVGVCRGRSACAGAGGCVQGQVGVCVQGQVGVCVQGQVGVCKARCVCVQGRWPTVCTLGGMLST